MRFLELHAENFGPLKDLHFEMHSDVFVVVGHNEAGKSSFHAALETILYGFEASSRDKHPLARFRPGEDLSLRAKVCLDNDTTLNVRRVLMTQGKLEIVDAEGQPQHASNNNEALPAMQSVPRSLFQAVYSLTANDTDMQKDDVRGHIRELLLGETGLRGARPISKVRAEVDGDMQALWRDDQRGTPVAKDLIKQIKQAKTERQAAKKLDRELREAKRELEALEPQRDADQSLLLDLRTQLEELSFHREWRAYLVKQTAVDKIDQRLVGCPEEWKRESLSDPAELEKKRDELARQLQEPVERLKQPTKSLTAEQQLCLDREAAIETVLAQIPDRKECLRNRDTAQKGLTESTHSLTEGLRRLGANGEARKQLANFPLAVLQADADQWDADLVQFDLESEERGPSPLWMGGVGVGIAGVILTGLQIGPLAAGLSATVAGFGFALACFLRPTKPTHVDPRPELPETSLALLTAIGLDEDTVRTPQILTRVADQLANGQRHLAEARAHMQAKKDAESDLLSLETNWSQLAKALSTPTGDMDALPSELRQALKRAEQALQEVREDGHQRQAAENQYKLLHPQWESCASKLQTAQSLLNTAFPDMADLTQAFTAWTELGRKRISAEEDLERLQGSPHFKEGGPPKDGETPGRDPQELRIAIETLEESTKEQSVRIGGLKQRLDSDKVAHLARAEESVIELEAKLQETKESRDQLALLGQVLRRAETSYREQNEPDVLQKAGEYLRAISQGRYTALAYPADTDGQADQGTLQVYSVEDGLVDVAKPLSRGTQEQIYLALRLGTLDYLDEGREKLPLILDEALVHWDRARRESLYAVLTMVAKARQVVLFTCHESFAEEVEEAMGARLIQLPNRIEPQGSTTV
ncbi:MAG: AAA family ATPase [Planctomycetota bacterium]|nr:AAA family ATPase [Planctomycetota bacterium]